MPSTYEPIATITLATASQQVVFSSIPTTYTDLRIVLAGFASGGTSNLRSIVNGEAGTVYSTLMLQGSGTAASTVSYNSQTAFHLGILPITTSFLTLDFFSYANSSFKTMLSTYSADTNGSGVVDRRVHLFQSTLAIGTISINVTTIGRNFGIGTTATLYGIKAA